MARQSGNIVIIGTINNLCFYRMDGKFYVRMKSSLTGKRVKKDPAFTATMHYAGLFGNASKIASLMYRSLQESAKTKELYRQLTGKAMQWLKEEYDPEEVMVLLQEAFVPKKARPEETKKSTEQSTGHYGFADVAIEGMGGETYGDDEGIFINYCICHAPP